MIRLEAQWRKQLCCPSNATDILPRVYFSFSFFFFFFSFSCLHFKFNCH